MFNKAIGPPQTSIDHSGTSRLPQSKEEFLRTALESYFDEVYQFAARRLKRREDAEDATSETFQAAHDQLHRFRGEETRLWLLGIARRKVANYQRREFRRKEESLADDLPSSASKTLEQREADSEVRKIVLSLPVDQRDALLLQHLEDLTVAQIAVVMRRSESSVASLLFRARASAYKKGERYFVEDQVKK
jgi:RNA polymerase sigma-70 factor (ECF subfamily)